MAVWFGSYMGNKYKEVKNFDEFFPNTFEGLDVYEPFGGSLGMSRKLFVDGKISKVYARDIDPIVLMIYKILSDVPDSEGVPQILREFDNLLKICMEEFEKNEKGGVYDPKKIILNTVCSAMEWSDDFRKYLETNMMFRGLMKTTNIIALKDTCHFMRVSDWKDQDYHLTFEEVQKKPNAFVFLDPPYFDSDNSYYNLTTKNKKKDENGFILDRTQLFIDILNFMDNPETLCKIMLIINSNAITNHIYAKFMKKEYTVIYQGSKKKTKHIVCTNYEQ